MNESTNVCPACTEFSGESSDPGEAVVEAPHPYSVLPTPYSLILSVPICRVMLLGLLLALLVGCKSETSLPSDIGGRIAFVSEQHTWLLGVSVRVRYGLYVLDLDTPEASHFVISPAEPILSHPAWSPAGEKLMLHRATYDEERGHRRRIVLVDVEASNQPEIFEDAWLGRDPIWSPDGTLSAFKSGNTLNLYDVGTRQRVKVLEAPGTILDPAWSLDGRSIAFGYRPDSDADTAASSTGGIALLGVEDASFTQLTSEDVDRSPAWSPEGRIAFVREGDIYLMEGDGSQVTRLTHDGQSFSPAWSPDGQKIAYLSSRDRECGRWFADMPPFCTNALYVMDADGANAQLLRQEDEHIHDPVWVP